MILLALLVLCIVFFVAVPRCPTCRSMLSRRTHARPMGHREGTKWFCYRCWKYRDGVRGL